MAQIPQYAATPKVGIAVISTANTSRDGTGTIGTVFSAGASGSRIDRIIVNATGTTTAGMVRLFIHDGTNARLFREISVSAATPSGTVQAFSAFMSSQNAQDIGHLPLVLPTGYSLRASTHNAESFVATAIGGDF
jgi:hypothetical protein